MSSTNSWNWDGEIHSATRTGIYAPEKETNESKQYTNLRWDMSDEEFQMNIHKSQRASIKRARELNCIETKGKRNAN